MIKDTRDGIFFLIVQKNNESPQRAIFNYPTHIKLRIVLKEWGKRKRKSTKDELSLKLIDDRKINR